MHIFFTPHRIQNRNELLTIRHIMYVVPTVQNCIGTYQKQNSNCYWSYHQRDQNWWWIRLGTIIIVFWFVRSHGWEWWSYQRCYSLLLSDCFVTARRKISLLLLLPTPSLVWSSFVEVVVGAISCSSRSSCTRDGNVDGQSTMNVLLPPAIFFLFHFYYFLFVLLLSS